MCIQSVFLGPDQHDSSPAGKNRQNTTDIVVSCFIIFLNLYRVQYSKFNAYVV